MNPLNRFFQLNKQFIIVLFISGTVNLFAQAPPKPNPKILISAEAGTSVLFGNSNLSPWGIQYRDQYKNGFVGNLKAFYLFKEIGAVGLKYSYFTDSENYLLTDNSFVADNVSIHYLAPQIGFRKYVTDRLIFGYAMGAGITRYHNEGLNDNKEFEANSNSIAGNFDFTFDYILFGNLAVGVDISLMGCNKFKKIDMNKGSIRLDNWNKLKFLRADFSIGIKGYF